MLRALALPFLVLVLFHGAAMSAPADRDIAAVKAADAERIRATTSNDFEALGKVLADDLVYTHSSGTTETKAEFIEALRSGRAKYQSIEPSDLRVRLYGTMALVNGQSKVVTGGREPKTFEIRWTQAWVKRGGRWQLVNWQSTKLP